MQRITGALIVALALVASSASAEERKEEKTTPQPQRRQIRVLQDPKDVASFYRSADSNGAARSAGPYGLASYYRSSAQNPRVYVWQVRDYDPSPYWGVRGATRRR